MKRRIWEIKTDVGINRPPHRVSSGNLGEVIDEWAATVEKSESEKEYGITIRSKVVEEK